MPPFEEIKTLSPNENNPAFVLERKNKLLLSYDKTNLYFIIGLDDATLSLYESIFSKPHLIKLLKYFRDVRASSPISAISATGIPEATIYRCLNQLAELGLIEPVSIVHAKRKGGQPPKIYATRDADKSDIQQAHLTHLRITSPIFAPVQQVLTQFKGVRETRFVDILDASKPFSQGFRNKEVADLVASELKEMGVKVWR